MEKQQVAAAVLSFAYRLDGVNVANFVNVFNVVNVVNGVNCQRFPLRPLPPVLPCCESSLRAGDVPSMGGQPLCVSVRHHIYCVTMALDCGRGTANIDNCRVAAPLSPVLVYLLSTLVQAARWFE